MHTLPTAASAVDLRPVAHFTANDSWLNDPNGLLYHEGTYHLFFQTNPCGSTWGNISWGHATSTDLVTWHERDVAIRFTPTEMAFSGSAVVDERNTAGFARAGETALVAIYTSAGAAEEGVASHQSQALAYSVDAGETWTRYNGNPVLDIGSTDFRDPKVFWYGGEDGHWVMVVVEAVARKVAFYSSPDLITWTRRSSFGPAHAVGGVWECPDLFPLVVEGTTESRWVLVVSMNPGGIAGGSGTQYFVGDFDGSTFTPDRLSDDDDPTDFDWLDYGRDYYAAVSFNNVPDGRRLMIGWASNWDYANQTPTHPWRSAMSLVREISLIRGADGRLRVRQLPVLPEDESGLAVFRTRVPAGEGEQTRMVLSNAAGDRLLITVDGTERTISCDRTASGETAFHDAFPSVDRAPFPVTDHGELEILVIADGTVVEVFVGDGSVTITQQVFPSAALDRLHIDEGR
ncbi:glycoside hydrolase family 32 protein [Microbacterium oleivorans]|uniref:glycoside hydrolase family 32 protein n=1 Tax=Microbacterium oleivorans TaxID=273677 RepID=UPI002116E40C|nr:glycoside hydrolase family 32 protein [Microbacterium oleivorans]